VQNDSRKTDTAIDMPTTALFILDAMTGEVKEFKKGYISTF
jgi:hypothetical protein